MATKTKKAPTVTAGEAAEFLGVHRNTIGRWYEQGRIRGKRQGKRLLITRDELERIQAVSEVEAVLRHELGKAYRDQYEDALRRVLDSAMALGRAATEYETAATGGANITEPWTSLRYAADQHINATLSLAAVQGSERTLALAKERIRGMLDRVAVPEMMAEDDK